MTNIELMKRRLEFQGGIHQEDRMIKGKYETFKRALNYSYQAAFAARVQRFDECLSSNWADEQSDEKTEQLAHVLINPDKVKQDYDDKILSIDYSYGWQPGDIFKWDGTDSYWIIYLQELTEDAYFRGEIRRCKYRLKFKDQDGQWVSTWAAIRGPVETQIDSIQKNQVRIDRPNLSLNILLPRNPQTLFAFDRYKEFLFAGRDWQVKAPDSISMKNIIEVAAEEHYIDRDTDDTEREMKNGLVVERYDPTPSVLSHIHGNGFIKPEIPEIYSVDIEDGKWSIEPLGGYSCEQLPIYLEASKDRTKCRLTWKSSLSFSSGFMLKWTKDDITYSRKIVVESLF